MDDGPEQLSDEQWNCLLRDGFVHLTNVYTSEEIEAMKAAEANAFDEAPYGRKEETGEVEDSNRVVGIGDDIDVIPLMHLPDNEARILKTLPGKPIIANTAERVLGKDFYLDRTVARRSRARSGGRLYFHKDQHGDLGMMVLVYDITEEDQGATVVMPGTHLGTPLPLFTMPNINDKHQKEVQGLGSAGDVYLFFRDIDHGRSANLSDHNTTQLLYTFVNKNTVPASWSRQGAKKEHLAGLPDNIHHMMRPYDGRPSDNYSGWVERFLYGSDFFSPGSGDYDVRNDLIRDFVYTITTFRGKDVEDLGEDPLPRYFTVLARKIRITPWDYLKKINFGLMVTNLCKQFYRRVFLGRRTIDNLKKSEYSEALPSL
ncbi:MAG: hypothetical protein HOK82_06845 [Rhodospirillaceae bacterium]|jgi:hypothetical protein|nr:hypothetical protein [Rhodospirillaceae bacterium]